MDIPEQFHQYKCNDYFNSQRFTGGIWSEPEQNQLILMASDVHEHPDSEFLVIGRPGVDEIEFGYRKNFHGIWSYYPISKEFLQISESVSTLVDGWFAGKIKV